MSGVVDDDNVVDGSSSNSNSGEAASFKLGDAVNVETKSGDILQGIIAFMGDVKFVVGSTTTSTNTSQQGNKKNDGFVGIRLTGTSVGKGKNDGSVQGIRYFKTPDDKSGMFVKYSNITHRTLSRLEELRLKRELSNTSFSTSNNKSTTPLKSRRKSSSNSSSNIPSSSSRSSLGGGGTGITTPKQVTAASASASLPLSISEETTSSTASSTAAADDSSSVVSSLTSTSTKSNKSRLEELRERRLAASSSKQQKTKSTIATNKKKGITTPTKTMMMTNTTNSDAKVQALEEKLRQSQDQCQELQTQLQQTKDQLQQAQTQTQVPPTPTIITTTTTNTNTMEDGGKQEGEEDKKKKELLGMIEKLQEELVMVKKEMKDRVVQLEGEKNMLEEQWTQNVDALQLELDKEASRHKMESQEYQKILDGTKKDLTKFQQQSNMKKQSESVHYKERAKLQADISALQRQIQEYQELQITHDNAMEDLVLDKESLQEQYEMMQDKMEELKIDAETSQIEVEELRLELEQAREAAASTNSNSNSNTAVAASSEEEDVMQALSVQNARLREAILRLREQTSMEKLNLTQQLRQADKNAQKAMAELSTLQQSHQDTKQLQQQVKELTDMVDQGSAMESMVEQLSDRVMGLEDDIANYISTIQELEEGTELAAEMEEAQADEIKALMMDLEGRDTLIRNLHEAIGIQRKRELDFAQTVTNYRSTVAKLKQQCSALVLIQESFDTKKSAAVTASQKALAKAAQYVADSQRTRKTEAQSIQYQIDASTRQHAVQRLEQLFPSACHTELHSIQGELLLHQVATKASLSLQSISTLYTESIQKSISSLQTNNNDNNDDDVGEEKEEVESKGDEIDSVGGGVVELSEEQVQQWEIMEHQLEFAKLAIDAGSHALRWMVTGQWPDQLTPQQSCDLACAAAVPYHAIDVALGEQLQILKEEGNLSPKHRSNLNTLSTSLQQLQQEQSILHNNNNNNNNDDNTVSSLSKILQDWNPPGWTIMKDIAISKYTCLAAASMISCAISTDDDNDMMFLHNNNNIDSMNHSSSSGGGGNHNHKKVVAKKLFQNLLEKLEMVGTEANRVLVVDPTFFTHTNSNDDNENLSTMTSEWKALSNNLLSFCQSLCEKSNTTNNNDDNNNNKVVMTNNTTKIKLCESQADATLRLVTKLSTTLRKHQQHQHHTNQQHALSPETNNAWKGVVSLVKQVRLVNGDADDLNYLIRGRDVEQQLTEAMENDAKLTVANEQVTTLEKTLSSKSKEISMQNVRLQELEQLLSTQNNNNNNSDNKQQHPTTPVKSKSSSSTTTDDVSSMKEENRVLNEAVEVLQTQVDEYEREIRSLKEPTKQSLLRTPNTNSKRASAAATATATPRKSVSFGDDNSDFYNYNQQQVTKGLSLEAAFYRPALRAARADATAWKVKSMDQQLSQLPPLILPDTNKISQLSRCSQELILASNQMRLDKASVRLVDIGRARLKQPSMMNNNVHASLERLREASRMAKQSLLQ